MVDSEWYTLYMKSQLSPINYNPSTHLGFTLIEVMIYIGLTAVVIGLFGGILITATRISGEQGSSVGVGVGIQYFIAG